MKNSSSNDEGSCVKCGTCTTVCPVYLATGNEIDSPRGRQHLRMRIAAGDVSSHYADIFSRCLLCGACRDACPRGLDTPELVIRVRAELPALSGLSFLKYVSRRALVHPALLTGLSRLGTVAGTLLGTWLPPDSGLRLRLQGVARESLQLPAAGYLETLKREAAHDGTRPDSDQTRRLSFFTGCLANHLQPEIAAATQFLLAKTTGGRARVPFAQTCCGMAALAAGRIEEARELARRNIAAFEADDFPILTSCSSCYYQLLSYKDLLADDPAWRLRAARFTGRLQEFFTFFLEKFSDSSGLTIPAGRPERQRVFYHDPCHLRFGPRITEEPRQLIRLLPGVELAELAGGARCCGQGGLFQVAHPQLSRRIRDKLMADFADLTAHTVLTACSGCLLQWRQGLAADPASAEAEHPAVFIARLL